MGTEIVGISRGLRPTFIVVVLDAVGVLITDHFRCDGHQLIRLDKCTDIDHPDVPVLIAQDYLAFLGLRIIDRLNICYLGTLLNTVHVLPLGQ